VIAKMALGDILLTSHPDDFRTQEVLGLANTDLILLPAMLWQAGQEVHLQICSLVAEGPSLLPAVGLSMRALLGTFSTIDACPKC
jgi:hypothetical protein